MRRGEVWLCQLSPTIGREQAGARPAVILSADEFNTSRAELVVVLPITSKPRALPSRVLMTPPEGGLSRESWIICEQPRTISTTRLRKRLGTARPATLGAVEVIVSTLLGFSRHR
jgi:mRNA interferase MazF